MCGSRDLCGSRGLPRTPDSLRAASRLQANLRTQGEVLQDHPAQALLAEILPQEDVRPGRRGLRNARADRLWLSRSLATGLFPALTPAVTIYPANLAR